MPLSHESTSMEVTCQTIYDKFKEKLLSYNDIAVQTSADLALTIVKEFITEGWILEKTVLIEAKHYFLNREIMSMELNCPIF